MHCPPAPQLLDLLVNGRSQGTDAGLASHAASCDSCRATLHELRSTVNALRLTRPAFEVGDDCLDDEWIASFADGDGDLMEAPQLAHVIGCAACQRRITSVNRLLRDVEVQHEIRLLESSSRRWPERSLGRRLALTGIAAASVAALLLVGRLQLSDDAGTPTYRERNLTEASPPVVIAPMGRVAAVDTLRWTSVQRANRYRLLIFDRDGTVLWETQTTDTAAALPPELARVGSMYLWRVEARVGWEDRWVASELTEFTILP